MPAPRPLEAIADAVSRGGIAPPFGSKRARVEIFARQSSFFSATEVLLAHGSNATKSSYILGQLSIGEVNNDINMCAENDTK